MDLNHSPALESDGTAVCCRGHPGAPWLLSLAGFQPVRTVYELWLIACSS